MKLKYITFAAAALCTAVALQAAEKIVAGRYSFFDLEDCELGNPPQWNRDPLTHRVAETRRSAASQPRKSSTSARDSSAGWRMP